MTPELQILLGSMVGGAGALLSYWAGWRARERVMRSNRYRAGEDSNGNCVPMPPAPPPVRGGVIGRPPVIFEEGHTMRGNGHGGPTTPRPEITPTGQVPSKPQPPPGRLIGPGGVPVGYQPKPQFPQPRTISGDMP